MNDSPGFEASESDADRTRLVANVIAPLIFPERYHDQARNEAKIEIRKMLMRWNYLGKRVMADALILLGIEPCTALGSQLGIYLDSVHEKGAGSLIPRNTMKEAWATVMDYDRWLYRIVKRDFIKLNPRMAFEDKLQTLRINAFYAGLFFEREKSGFPNYFSATWAWYANQEIRCNQMMPIPTWVMERAYEMVDSARDDNSGKGSVDELADPEKSQCKNETIVRYRELMLMAKRRHINIFDIEQGMAMRDLEGRDSGSSKIHEEILAEPLQEAGYLRNESVREMGRALRLLDSKEKVVIENRFGLGETPQKTLKEVGGIFGRTKETARNYETKALRKMRILMCD